MGKAVIFCLCIVFVVMSKEIISTSRAASERNTNCSSSYDCLDLRMVCLKNKTCGCSKFHDWHISNKRCLINLTKIFHWLRGTMSTESDSVSQQEDFEVQEINSRIILKSKWAEYEGAKETGLGHVTLVIWPIWGGVVVIFIIYGAILLEYM